MENLTILTGLSQDELREAIHEIIIENVMNSNDISLTKRHVIVLNAIYELL